MNIFEFITILLLIPFVISVLKFIEKLFYKSSVSPNMQKLYNAKAMYENIGKLNGDTIKTVLSCNLFYHYIGKDKELLNLINKVLINVGREKI